MLVDAHRFIEEGANIDLGDEIAQSAIFHAPDANRLIITPGVSRTTAQRRRFTISRWIKRTTLNAQSATFLHAYAGISDLFHFGTNSGGDRIIFYDIQSGTDYGKVYNAQFRDHAEWYHFHAILDTPNATVGQRLRVYVNGVQLTDVITDYGDFPLNHTTDVGNSGFNHYIGYTQDQNTYSDYIGAQFGNWYDQVVEPTEVGRFNGQGVWVPKTFAGTFNADDEFFAFQDNTNFGDDTSGNANDGTAVGFTTAHQVTDTPNNNHCVINRNDQIVTNINVRDGGLEASTDSGGSATWRTVRGTLPLLGGKWYWEVKVDFITANNYWIAGIMDAETQCSTTVSTYTGQSANSVGRSGNGTTYHDGSSLFTGDTSLIVGNVLNVAFDADSGEIWFGVNGTWDRGDPALGTTPSVSGLTDTRYWPSHSSYFNGTSGYATCTYNFGQRAFNNTPPTGFQKLNAANLPAPVIDTPSDYFNTVLYAGTGTTNPVTGVGHSPDLVWLKNRDGVTGYSHALMDTVRGVNSGLNTNGTGNEFATQFDSFDVDGFTVSGNTNQYNVSTDNFVAWCWKEGAIPGFDIVTYSGTGVAHAENHSLGVKPDLIIVKRQTGGAADWLVYDSINGANNRLLLSQTNDTAADSTAWNNTEPTTTQFTVGTNVGCNDGSSTYVAYLFASISQFSKIGIYDGSGTTDGVFVPLDFAPEFVMWKEVTGSNASTSHWNIHDATRDDSNVANTALYPNLANDEDALGEVDLLSTGFKLRTAHQFSNESSGVYLFAAFARNPIKTTRAR